MNFSVPDVNIVYKCEAKFYLQVYIWLNYEHQLPRKYNYLYINTIFCFYMALFLSGPGKQRNEVEKIPICSTPIGILPLSKLLTITIAQPVLNAAQRSACAGGWVDACQAFLDRSITRSRGAVEGGPGKKFLTHPVLRGLTWRTLGLSLFPLNEYFPRVFLDSTFKESPGCPVLLIHLISRHLLTQEKIQESRGLYLFCSLTYSQYTEDWLT